MCKTPALFRYPRSEPDCAIWSFLARSNSHSSDTRNNPAGHVASQLKHDGAAGAVLKSWMQGWRVTCRACGPSWRMSGATKTGQGSRILAGSKTKLGQRGDR